MLCILIVYGCDSDNLNQYDYLSCIILIYDALDDQLENDTMPQKHSEYQSLVHNIINESYYYDSNNSKPLIDSQLYYNQTNKHFRITFDIYSNFPPVYIESQMAAPLFMFKNKKECFLYMTNTLHTITEHIRNHAYESINIEILNYFGYHHMIQNILRDIQNNDNIPGSIRSSAMRIYIHNIRLHNYNYIVHDPIE